MAVVNKAGINSSVQTCVCVCVNISIQINWANVGVCAQLLSHVQLFETPQPIAHQTLLSMGYSWQEYWNGLPFLPPGDLPNPGIESGSSALQANCLPSESLLT